MYSRTNICHAGEQLKLLLRLLEFASVALWLIHFEKVQYTYQVVGSSTGPQQALLVLTPLPHQSAGALNHSRWSSAPEPPQPVMPQALWALPPSHQSLLALFPLLLPLCSRQSARLEQQASGNVARQCSDRWGVYKWIMTGYTLPSDGKMEQ